MSRFDFSGAGAGHFPEIQKYRARRVLGRISASDAVASLLADLAFGRGQRDDVALLVDLTATRTAAAGGLHG